MREIKSRWGGAHGHWFGNRSRPARPRGADRAGRHLSDDVLSFRMNKRPRLALSPFLLAPIFLGFTLNGWRIRILPPKRRSTCRYRRRLDSKRRLTLAQRRPSA